MNPDQFTISEVRLAVRDGHALYVQEWGNAVASQTIIFLHGGPGSGLSDSYKNRFEPLQHRVIFFDQRGCGQSTPSGSLVDNTTDQLVADISAIADHFELANFVLIGGSWGSTLALTYAIRHPKRVSAMILSGIFTARQSELDWINKGHFKTIFPDVWQRFCEATPAAERNDPASYHIRQILGPDEIAAKRSAFVYSQLEGSLLKLDDRYSPENYDTYEPAGTRLEIHYLANGCFLTENYILDHTTLLTMPIWIVQGRYDMVCPPITAYELDQKLPQSKLIWTTAGHANDRPNYDAIKTILLNIAG